MPDGSRLRLKGDRVGARWTTSKRHVKEFVRAMTDAYSLPETPAPRWPAEAARASSAADAELERMVARELERRWEEALKARRHLDDEYDRFARSAPARLSDDAVASIRALAADLPAVWSAATTTPADRRRVARLLLERVVVTVDKASERVDVTLHWVGGVTRPHTITRPVTRYSRQSDYPRLVARLRELCTGRLNSAAIAGRLNAEGFSPPKRTTRFTGAMVRRLTALVPALRPGDTAVLDNLPCHKSAAVRAAVEAAGCRLVFLPPYGPDLNPIELTFARLKRLLRSDGHRTVPTLVTFLDSVGRAFRPAECAAYIRHCGYGQAPATASPNQR